MTAPGYPYVRPQPPKRSTADVVATVVTFTLAAALALLCLASSLFFPMVTDSCANQCNDAMLGWAYLVTWGGVVIAALVAIGGSIFAAVRGRVMWVWPTVGLGLVVVAAIIGVALANSVFPRH
jgi:hypothetical protein